MTVKELKEELCEWDETLLVCIVGENNQIEPVQTVKAYEDEDPNLLGRLMLT